MRPLRAAVAGGLVGGLLLTSPAAANPSAAVPAPGRWAVADAPTHHPPAAGRLGLPGATRWSTPVRPLVILRRFDPPVHDWLPGHRGVDLKAHDGQPVRAAGAGQVSFAAELAGRGVVVVNHGSLRTTYEPVAASVHRGDHVSAGDPLGVIAPGSGHCGSGGCLHFGVRMAATYLDPLFLLRGYQAVLRPL